MKKVANEGEPVVVVPVVVEPVEVGIALVVVPPRNRHLAVALKRNVWNVIRATTP